MLFAGPRRWLAFVCLGLPALCAFGVTSYAWYHGFAVGSAVLHLFDTYPTVKENPSLEDIATHRVTWMGDIENHDLTESSGLAASNLNDDVLWSINDSGSGPEIFALTTEGGHLGTWSIEMDDPIDWEAMDSFILDGIAYLLVADVGDNLRWRSELSMVIVREPELTTKQQVLPVEWAITYRYPDGYRDCEAVAVDEVAGEVLLLTKRHRPGELFSVPLRSNDIVTAVKRAELTDLPLPTEHDEEYFPDIASFRYMPSGMDLAGDRLLITTYKDAFLYRLDALQQPPQKIPLPSIGQREAIAFARGRDNVAYVTRERHEGVADIFRLDFSSSRQRREAVTVGE